jgi:hypothetical protein
MACIAPLASSTEKGSTGTIISEFPCFESKYLAGQLTSKFGEMPMLVGEATDQAKSIMTLWMNPNVKTWTLVATSQDTSCIIGVGENLQIIPYGKINSLDNAKRNKNIDKLM